MTNDDKGLTDANIKSFTSTRFCRGSMSKNPLCRTSKREIQAIGYVSTTNSAIVKTMRRGDEACRNT